MAIAQISQVAGLVGRIGSAGQPAQEGGGSFGDTLHKLVEAVDTTDAQANQSIASMLDGSGDVHTAMIAMQRAEHTLQLTIQIRNKLVQAYQDVMRMPV